MATFVFPNQLVHRLINFHPVQTQLDKFDFEYDWEFLYPHWKFINWNKLLIICKWFWFRCWNMNFFITFLKKDSLGSLHFLLDIKWPAWASIKECNNDLFWEYTWRLTRICYRFITHLLQIYYITTLNYLYIYFK